jgi:hypothetical protein
MRRKGWRGIRSQSQSRRCSVGGEIEDRNSVNGVTDRTKQGAYEREKGLRRWRQQTQIATADGKSSV